MRQKKTNLINISSTLDMVWLAAVVDGEGWIGIRERSKNKGYYYSLLEITNTNLEFLNKVVSITGMSRIYSKKRKNKKWKDTFRWILEGDRVVDILTQIIPFLIIKRKQAELAILLQNTNKQYGELKRTDGKGGTLLSEREKEYRKSLYLQIRELNKKGR